MTSLNVIRSHRSLQQDINMTKELLAFFVCVVVLGQTYALRCRRCDSAANLEDCSNQVQCGHDEVCFMDAVVTQQLATVYSGGCRARTSCIGSVAVGKRAVGITCSKCCSGANDCNLNLCGIKSVWGNTNQCYSCPHGVMGNMSSCQTITTCNSDQVCVVDEHTLANRVSYIGDCRGKRMCSLLTKLMLQDLDACKHDPLRCGTGKRQVSGTSTCSVCCGDRLCNNDSCHNIKERLYAAWKQGTLDLTSIQIQSSTTG